MKISSAILFLLLSFLSTQLSSQISLGAKLSHVKAHQEYGDVILPDNAEIHVNGVQGALMVYYPLSKHLSLGLEPGLVQRGAACEPGFDNFVADTKLLLTYAELPLMLSARLPFLRNRLALLGKLGYGAGFLLQATREVTQPGLGSQPLVTRLDLENSNELTRWDHGAHLGLGLAFQFGKNQLLLESSYYAGIPDADPENTSKNRGLQMGLGYLITL